MFGSIQNSLEGPEEPAVFAPLLRRISQVAPLPKRSWGKVERRLSDVREGGGEHGKRPALPPPGKFRSALASRPLPFPVRGSQTETGTAFKNCTTSCEGRGLKRCGDRTPNGFAISVCRNEWRSFNGCEFDYRYSRQCGQLLSLLNATLCLTSSHSVMLGT